MIRHWLVASNSLVLSCIVSATLAAGPRGPTPDQEIGILSNEDIAAVQKPLFSAESKLEVGLHAAAIPNDPYVWGLITGLSASYYLSERSALEVLLSYGNGWDTYESLELQELGVRVDAYTARFIAAANGQWTPIYAKLNLLGTRVLHFDTSATAGLGVFVARRVIYNDTEAIPGADRFNLPLSVNFGLNQRYYAWLAGYMVALRLEARDYLYLVKTLEDSFAVKHNWTLGVGVSCFFDLKRKTGVRHD